MALWSQWQTMASTVLVMIKSTQIWLVSGHCGHMIYKLGTAMLIFSQLAMLQPAREARVSRVLLNEVIIIIIMWISRLVVTTFGVCRFIALNLTPHINVQTGLTFYVPYCNSRFTQQHYTNRVSFITNLCRYPGLLSTEKCFYRDIVILGTQ